MGDEAVGDVAHAERSELDALRRRAYGPDADILDDPVALARLAALEDRVRIGRTPPAADADAATRDPVETEAAAAPAPAPAPPLPAAGTRAPGWHRGLVTSTAVVALLLGGAAWADDPRRTSPEPESADAKATAVERERRAAWAEKEYNRYVDGLREEVLALAGEDPAADRLIRDQLVPYGILYGRTVGAGPTVDSEFCMIIADLPQPSITCIPVENAYANPVSVQLPSWYSDADSDLFTGLGGLVAYTLMPGGSVVAEYVSDRTRAAAQPDTAAPTPTAVPPPGWQ